MRTDNAYLGSATRRRLLTAAPGSLLWVMAGGLGTGVEIATAQPIQAGAVPEVDRLAVRVVTDSYHHAFEASRTVGDVQLQRVGNALQPNAQPRTQYPTGGSERTGYEINRPVRCSLCASLRRPAGHRAGSSPVQVRLHLPAALRGAPSTSRP